MGGLFKGHLRLWLAMRRRLWWIFSVYSGFSWRTNVLQYPNLDLTLRRYGHSLNMAVLLSIIHISSGLHLLLLLNPCVNKFVCAYYKNKIRSYHWLPTTSNFLLNTSHYLSSLFPWFYEDSHLWGCKSWFWEAFHVPMSYCVPF